MLDSLIYSINAVFPIILLVALGWFLKHKNFLSDAFFNQSERLVFKVALPAMLFLDVSGADPASVFDAGLIGYCVCGIILTFLLPCLIVPLFIKDDAKRGAFIQGVYRSNFAIIGLTLAANMFGDDGVAQIAMIMPFAIVLYNVLAVIILSVYAPCEKKLDGAELAGSIVFNIIKNPLIISIVLALPFMIFRIELPPIVDKSLTYLSNATMPLALLSLGACFTIEGLKGRLSLAAIATTIKTVVFPAAAVTGAILIGFRGPQLGGVLILFGGPTAVTSYIMAKNMGSDYELAGQILLLTTFVCAFTLFAGIFVLNYFMFI